MSVRCVRAGLAFGIVLVALAQAACSGQASSTGQSTVGAASGTSTASNANSTLAGVDGSTTLGQNANACTVFANSNQIGSPCTSPAFGAGVNDCVGGALVCELCLPGATQSTPCACGTNRVDICSDQHTWLSGTCSLCPPADNCRSGSGCTPGTTETRRCDSCTGSNCNTPTAVNCVGSKWLCDASCTWQQTAACAALSPVCTQDTTQTEACGWCGTQAMTCDGCFWVAGPCTGQGVCPAGNVQTVPCGALNSAGSTTCPTQSTTATTTCSALCQWSPPSSCSCKVGATQTATVSCPSGQCGTAVQSQICVAVNVGVCGNLDTLASTQWQNSSASPDLSKCSTSCGGGSNAGGACTTCVAGDTRTVACTSTCSLPGNQTETCTSDGCGWATTGSCVPQDRTRCIGGTVVTHEACAAGYCSRSADPTHHLTTCQNNCYPLDQPCVACN